MTKIEKFEDLDVWQKTRQLSRLIYQVTSKDNFSRDFALRDQIRRAAVSVLSNISEGFERGGDKEFRQFLSVAKGSVGELRSQLYVALDANYLNHNEFDQLYALADQIGKMIGGFMRYLQTSSYIGPKFKNDSVSESVLTRDSGLGIRD